MPDYAKMKNAELESLLKSRGLPTGGKKADMVDRLTKADEEKKAPAAPAKTLDEDEIDWDDDTEPVKPQPQKSTVEASAAAAKATTEPAAAAIKAGGQGQAANPQAVPNQVADIDPSTTEDLSVDTPAKEVSPAETAAPAATEATAPTENAATEAAKEPEKPDEPPVDYSRGLAATKLDEEIEKRKARAKKFGMNVDEDEGLKALERAKKFGESGPPKGLDEALPEVSRKRGREGDHDGGRQKRRGGGGRFGERRGGGNRGRDKRPDNRRQDSRRQDNKQPENKREQRPTHGNNGSWMSEADKAKAEARKNRFAAPAPAAST
ncbi:hypothetical protein GQ43DRAFT_436605 [Delitschia confertaspora ATCC 74209]|uniref:SAP domain-containing protein n=1 Tax=Delitschia confertaspora ATCC 74209 TaxID=1513339 RepID=A0A9P4JZ58_9PLEO|nr:hypothetical protein GQ43DRAFT_436605 [Delitschia confertaspora ATCC 74209]